MSTSGDALVQRTNNTIQIPYVSQSGGLKLFTPTGFSCDRTSTNLVGEDGKRWSDGELTMWTYLLAFHLFCLEFPDKPPSLYVQPDPLQGDGEGDIYGTPA